MFKKHLNKRNIIIISSIALVSLLTTSVVAFATISGKKSNSNGSEKSAN
jgi:hypothetical protein